MKYQRIPTSLFIKNRKKFTASMKPGSIAIFHSNDEVPRNGDAFHKFKQNSDLFYLSGIDQEETILVLFPDCPNPLYREMLFIKETSVQCPNPLYREMLFIKETSVKIAIWDGARLMPEEASAASGIERVFWYHEFKKTIHAAFLMAETIYMNLNENDRSTDTVPANAFRFAHEIKYRYPAHNYARSAPILAQCRMVKEQEEIDLISEAVNITRAGFERLLTFVKPGVWEYEIEAELIHEFTRRRSNGFAFDPIIGSGSSACVLHYVENNKICKDGDLLLLDFGAEYANYNGDLTRCLPVNGNRSIGQQRDF